VHASLGKEAGVGDIFLIVGVFLFLTNDFLSRRADAAYDLNVKYGNCQIGELEFIERTIQLMCHIHLHTSSPFGTSAQNHILMFN